MKNMKWRSIKYLIYIKKRKIYNTPMIAVLPG